MLKEKTKQNKKIENQIELWLYNQKLNRIRIWRIVTPLRANPPAGQTSDKFTCQFSCTRAGFDELLWGLWFKKILENVDDEVHVKFLLLLCSMIKFTVNKHIILRTLRSTLDEEWWNCSCYHPYLCKFGGQEVTEILVLNMLKVVIFNVCHLSLCSLTFCTSHQQKLFSLLMFCHACAAAAFVSCLYPGSAFQKHFHFGFFDFKFSELSIKAP